MSEKIKQDISIGNNLKALRQNVNLSQEQVAAKLQMMGLSVSREMLSQMELGRYNIRVSILVALKQIYNATFDDFFKDLEQRKHT
jgi:transcriptional regulator with XRE-family HTH domain